MIDKDTDHSCKVCQANPAYPPDKVLQCLVSDWPTDGVTRQNIVETAFTVRDIETNFAAGEGLCDDHLNAYASQFRNRADSILVL